MIPLGVLASARVASAGGSLSLVYQGVATPTNVAGVSTYTAAPIGTASATRTVIVAATSWSGGSRSISGITIGGAAATLDAIANARTGPSAIARLAVPTGTAADVVVTASDNTPAFSIAVWTVNANVVPVSTAIPGSFGSGTTSMGAVLSSTTAGGFAIAAHRSRAGARTTTWTNATERYDPGVAQPYSGADTTTAGGALTITATFSSATDSTTTYLAAAYEPA